LQKRTPPQQHKDKRDRGRRKQIKRPLPLFFSLFRSLFFLHFRVKNYPTNAPFLLSFYLSRPFFASPRERSRFFSRFGLSSSRGNFRANEGSCQHDLVILGCFLWCDCGRRRKGEKFGANPGLGTLGPREKKASSSAKTSPSTREFTLNTRLQHTHKIWVAFARKRSRRYVCNTNQT